MHSLSSCCVNLQESHWCSNWSMLSQNMQISAHQKSEKLTPCCQRLFKAHRFKSLQTLFHLCWFLDILWTFIHDQSEQKQTIREKRRELWCWREGHVGANLFSADLTKSIIAILGPALPLNQIASIHLRISFCRLFSKLPGKFLFLTFRQGSCVALCSVIASDRLFGLNISSYFPSSPFPSLHLFLSISTDSWLVPNPEWLWPPLSTPGVQLFHLIFPTFAGLFSTTTALILYYIICLSTHLSASHTFSSPANHCSGPVT